ncbi:hypothetical protein AYL99_11760 [Fonsecaea erecta]|uniref:DUF3669 domain-containing protein n=1 Tax=Fonsecaea erecta TaxID=1367422 RepID=A0A178Z2K8_9EURO|nr:hypothetical protein AYL99_11760 [Fonsecaea erecta]OAP54000.1 hypothetical protein AYL99_11760 [Fonsecaea erecta]
MPARQAYNVRILLGPQRPLDLPSSLCESYSVEPEDLLLRKSPTALTVRTFLCQSYRVEREDLLVSTPLYSVYKADGLKVIMSRRDNARTDASVISVTDSLKSLMASTLRYAGEMSGLTFLDDTALRQYGPEQVLHRMLSTKSYISTSSSLAAKNQAAHDKPGRQAFTQVGKGQCGTVWALTGTTQVFKIMNEGKQGQLWNDYCQHASIEEAFLATYSGYRRNISLPRVSAWVGPDNEMFWEEHRGLFPEASSIKPTSGFLSERIFPVPLPVRAALVDAFAPREVKKNKESFLSQPENKDCLIRIYLGRRQTRPATNTFRLRNFDMTVNEMEFLRLDTSLYAETLAQMLAIIHWKANLDANDVEFVFGSAPAVKGRPTAAELKATNPKDVQKLVTEIDFNHRSIGIWVLDFDQCKEFAHDQGGVKQLERGFYFNDPYYPRPVSTDPKDVALWNTFKECYLDTSAAFIASGMPQQFIDAVEAEGRKRGAGGSLFK